MHADSSTFFSFKFLIIKCYFIFIYNDFYSLKLFIDWRNRSNDYFVKYSVSIISFYYTQ